MPERTEWTSTQRHAAGALQVPKDHKHKGNTETHQQQQRHGRGKHNNQNANTGKNRSCNPGPNEIEQMENKTRCLLVVGYNRKLGVGFCPVSRFHLSTRVCLSLPARCHATVAP
mmetsp:Transcript_42182/g.78103  ORF Transcript_42182/g.78103 Transcript_42182/m.78103 type:complete len:114 (-) Transcript_42182:329-670(-)|eukprot:TRINITY_DN76469_c0_g1_i1.p2 TRINITY_DN76469_c0_g1~~TRINITY_DN76469_c0_g1_i1.p2  ORF type:complete len:114 (-),score=4.02 TRINITY_DN76469_c0_g1_i1:329-670(-)